MNGVPTEVKLQLATVKDAVSHAKFRTALDLGTGRGVDIQRWCYVALRKNRLTEQAMILRRISTRFFLEGSESFRECLLKNDAV